jgi:four helix bundle protein
MKNFKELKVWEKAHQLTIDMYQITRAFPNEEIYGLTSQIRRAAASVPANIAEGCGRSGDAELARFLRIAMGSASELEYHLILVKDLALIDGSTCSAFIEKVIEIKKMLTAFIKQLT